MFDEWRAETKSDAAFGKRIWNLVKNGEWSSGQLFRRFGYGADQVMSILRQYVLI